MQISVIINTKNGEKYLSLCLNALYEFHDVIIVDNFSTDNTKNIALRYKNVTFYEHEFSGMGNLRNLAASYAKYDWILIIDCDEIISNELINSLKELQLNPNNIYKILRKNYYNNLEINSSAWENDWVMRLYNRNSTNFNNNQVHESLQVNNLKIIKLTSGIIYHFPYANINELVNKMQLYSTLYAQQNFQSKTIKLWMIPFRAFIMFIKCYIFKKGFKDGFAGFTISSYNAIGVFTKYLKLYELINQKQITLFINITKNLELKTLIYNINQQKLLPYKVYFLIFTQDYSQNELNNFQNLLNNFMITSFELINYTNHQELISNLTNIHINQKIIYLNDTKNLKNHLFIKSFRKFSNLEEIIKSYS